MQGNVEEAIPSCRRALEIKPEDANAYRNLGMALAEQGKFEEAILHYRRALEIKPEFAEAYNSRGITLKKLKRLDEALASYDRALTIKPDYAEAYSNRGNALLELKRLDEALASYDRALTIKPDYANAYSNRGATLIELKRLDEALASYDRALKIKPDYAEAYNNRGNTLQKLRQLDEALASYDCALKAKPDYAEAYNNRGNALHELKRLDEALASYDRALKIKPDYAEAYNNRGNTLHELKRLDEALASYDRALTIKPGYAEAYNNRGNTLHELKRLDEALASYDRALKIMPDYAEAYNNCGNTLHELKRLDEALASYDRALTIKPDYADAYNNRGNTLQEFKRLDEALASYDRALTIKPDYAEAYSNRGNTLHELKRLNEALVCYDRALKIKPDYAGACNNRGITLKTLKRLDEALASFDRALKIKPDYAEAYSNRGNTLLELKRLDEALACYDRALKIKPDYAEAYLNCGMLKLLGGNYREGWLDYEWRWKTAGFSSKCAKINARAWQGEDIAGRSILVFSEQGLGDEIQFARYLPLLAQRGAKVTFFGSAQLIPLFQRQSTQVEFVSSLGLRKSFDFQCPLMSLPLRFGTDLGSIPHQVHITSQPGKLTEWQARLGARSKPRIGLVWSGNPEHKNDHNRSISLLEVAKHLPHDYQYVSLQKEVRDSDKAVLKAHTEILHFGAQLIEFADTIALIENLDLVITVDTSVAHLAGAMGKPTWVLLPFVPDWRWLLDRDDSPWYPSMRLFRQAALDDWDDVFQRIQVGLTERLQENSELDLKNRLVPLKHSKIDNSMERIHAEMAPSDVDVVDLHLQELDELHNAESARRIRPSSAVTYDVPVLENGHVRLRRCRYGWMLYFTTDQYIGQSLDLYGEFSEREVDIFRQMLKPGQTILEIGSNIGAHTVFLAQAVGPQGRVVAFEPQRIVFQMLCANIALNGLRNVDARHAAVGREPGRIVVPTIDYAESVNSGGLSLGNWSTGECVSLLTLDGLDMAACHFIKIDVEGMEGDVLAGAVETINRFRPALYVENDRKEKSTELIERLLRLDYRLYWHLPPLFNRKNFAGHEEDVFGRIVSVNMLCLPRSAPQNIEGFREITSPEGDWR
ncbi:MAG: FkbM family methyltransferase [Candidatus Accumulibacter meliphilus]|uniref:FkbM family methyltransferase n=1 Tax=Candidatus Accumulibacter meliphilus TaxID=2211374 RepID=UPI002FC2C661